MKIILEFMKKRFFLTFSSFIGLFVFVQNVFAQCTIDGEIVPCEDVAVAATGLAVSVGFILLSVFFIGFLFLISIFGFVLWIWMIIDAAKNEKDNDLLVWILVLVFVQIVGAIIYYFVRKRPRDDVRKNGGVSVTN